jgi:hypothetical protein
LRARWGVVIDIAVGAGTALEEHGEGRKSEGGRESKRADYILYVHNGLAEIGRAEEWSVEAGPTALAAT